MGCQPMEPGKPFEPVPPEECECDCPVCPEEDAAEDTTEDTDAETEATADAEDTDAAVEPAGAEGDPFAAALQGQPEATEEATETDAETAPEVADQAWTPSLTNPAWGVRLVSVVPGASPPQAILGLSDGTSLVVRAGDMVPSVGVVVIAIGKDRAQLAQVKPAGDHAVVESIQLSAMYPSSP